MYIDYEKLDKLNNDLNALAKRLDKNYKRKNVEREYIKKGKSTDKEKELEAILKRKVDKEDRQIKFDI